MWPLTLSVLINKNGQQPSRLLDIVLGEGQHLHLVGIFSGGGHFSGKGHFLRQGAFSNGQGKRSYLVNFFIFFYGHGNRKGEVGMETEGVRGWHGNRKEAWQHKKGEVGMATERWHGNRKGEGAWQQKGGMAIERGGGMATERGHGKRKGDGSTATERF